MSVFAGAVKIMTFVIFYKNKQTRLFKTMGFF